MAVEGTAAASAPSFQLYSPSSDPKHVTITPMIVRGFETADGRTVERGQFGEFPKLATSRLSGNWPTSSSAPAPNGRSMGPRTYPTAGSGRRRWTACCGTALTHGSCCPSTSTRSRALFGESAARAVVAMRAGTELRVRELCEATGVPYTAIGTTGGDALPVGDLFDVRLDELRAVPEAPLPVAFE